MDSNRFKGAFLCALFPIAAVLATLPFVEMGINDDFCYTRIALLLANTGKIAYSGLESPGVGLQAYWAAVFIKLFGFSFLLVRLSALPFAIGCSVLLYLISLHGGLSRLRAIFFAFLFSFSPLALPLEASFMTDVPATFFALLCVVFAIQATDPKAAYPQTSWPKVEFWAAMLTVAGLAGGTIRQYVFLVPAAFLPYIAWRSRRARIRWWCGACGLVCVMGAVAFERWFSLQPYTVAMPLLPLSPDAGFLHIGFNLVALLIEYAVLLMPLTFLYLPGIRSASAGLIPAIAGLIAAAEAVIAAWHHHTPFAGNIVTITGVLDSGTEVIGIKPLALPIPLQIVLAGIGTVLFALAVAELLSRLRDSHQLSGRMVAEWLRSGSGRARVEHACILFGLIYSPLVLSRAIEAHAFDRYILPLLATGGLLLLLGLPDRLAMKLPIGWVLAALFGVYGIATTHDYFARSRARLSAANLLEKAQVPRQCISAGLEYDAWTELELRGHLNFAEARNPPGAYQDQSGRRYPIADPYWFWEETPSIEPAYIVVTSPQPGLSTLKQYSVPYEAWLPPFERSVLVQTAGSATPECGRNPGTTPALRQF